MAEAERHPLVVTDSSALIALCGIGHVPLLEDLFERTIVPVEVWQELADKVDAPEPGLILPLRGLNVLPPRGPAPAEASTLGSGERSAIAIALEHPGAWLLVEELRARKIARRLGLDVRGTLAVLVEAKRRGLVPAIGPLVERLTANGVWLGPALIAVRRVVLASWMPVVFSGVARDLSPRRQRAS